jgi:hypothetical protein
MTGAIPKTGSLGVVPQEYDPIWFQTFIDRLEQIHILLAQPAGIGYAMSNVTPDRVLDVDSTTLAEVADVLGTLIDDLKDAGIISK